MEEAGRGRREGAPSAVENRRALLAPSIPHLPSRRFAHLHPRHEMCRGEPTNSHSHYLGPHSILMLSHDKLLTLSLLSSLLPPPTSTPASLSFTQNELVSPAAIPQPPRQTLIPNSLTLTGGLAALTSATWEFLIFPSGFRALPRLAPVSSNNATRRFQGVISERHGRWTGTFQPLQVRLQSRVGRARGQEVSVTGCGCIMRSGLGAPGDRPLKERRPPCSGQQPGPTGRAPIWDSSRVRGTARMHPGGPLGDEKRAGTPASEAVICLLPCSRCFTSARGQGEAANKTNTPVRSFQEFFPAAPASKTKLWDW